jgi:hypothetical protein
MGLVLAQQTHELFMSPSSKRVSPKARHEKLLLGEWLTLSYFPRMPDRKVTAQGVADFQKEKNTKRLRLPSGRVHSM